MRAAAQALIRLYQKAVSPLFPGCCRFQPTCSEYASEALSRHGLLKGSLLTGYRLLRCHPLCRGGFDPVPEPRSAKHQAS